MSISLPAIQQSRVKASAQGALRAAGFLTEAADLM
jgi:hypothetical protein